MTVTALLRPFVPSTTWFPLDTAMHDLVPIFFTTLLLTELAEALPPLSPQKVTTFAVSPLAACFLVLLLGLRKFTIHGSQWLLRNNNNRKNLIIRLLAFWGTLAFLKKDL